MLFMFNQGCCLDQMLSTAVAGTYNSSNRKPKAQVRVPSVDQI